jgi:hypothetical protein
MASPGSSVTWGTFRVYRRQIGNYPKTGLDEMRAQATFGWNPTSWIWTSVPYHRTFIEQAKFAETSGCPRSDTIAGLSNRILDNWRSPR